MESLEYANGIHHISSDNYHASGAVSRSRLSYLKKTPKEYWYHFLSGLKGAEPPTEAMVFGELFHTLTLEPHLFFDNFIIEPVCDKRTKEGKTIYENFLSCAGDKQIITEKHYTKALNMASEVREDKLASALLADCHIEQSIFFTHEPTGIQCKVRPDAWLGCMAFDLKSAKDASERGFQSSAALYDYYLQAAMNFKAFESIGVTLDEFIFIAVEKEEPHLIAIDRVSREESIGPDLSALDYGLRIFDERMSLLKQCRDNKSWPSYGVRELKVPKWAKYEQLLEVE